MSRLSPTASACAAPAFSGEILSVVLQAQANGVPTMTCSPTIGTTARQAP
jgi:hypothetical protein